MLYKARPPRQPTLATVATVRERLISAGLDEATVDGYLTDGWVRVDGDRVTDGSVESDAGIVLLPPRG